MEKDSKNHPLPVSVNEMFKVEQSGVDSRVISMRTWGTGLSMVILRGERLIRGFGEGALRILALRDVSIDLMAGQTTVLMVSSGGRGKSTSWRYLAGLSVRIPGEVEEALGHSVVHMTDSEREDFRRKHCGFVFQGYNLFPPSRR